MNGNPLNNDSPERPGRQKQSRKFPRGARLLKHSDFQRVYQQGERHFARHLTAFFLRRHGEQTRIGFTVSRALGGSVERNRIRRRMREAVRLRYGQAAGGFDVVFNPKKTAAKAEFSELVNEVGRAFEAIAAKSRKS